MLKKISKGLALVGGIGMFALIAMFGLVSQTHAVADATLVSTIASSSGFFVDNSAVLVSFIVDIVLKLSGIALAIGAIYWVYRKIKSIFYK